MCTMFEFLLLHRVQFSLCCSVIQCVAFVLYLSYIVLKMLGVKKAKSQLGADKIFTESTLTCSSQCNVSSKVASVTIFVVTLP